MSKGNTTSNASAMGYSNAASSASEKVPGEVRLANANAMGDASASSDSNASCAVSANAAGKAGVADALAAHEEDVAGANMADAAVSGGAASVTSSADAEGPSSPTGASIPGNIARAYEALDSFWREQNQLYRDVAASFGISESAFNILYAIYLAGEKGIAQRDICMQMCIGKQTVNSSIHKLEREGVVVLKSGLGRRGLLAHLTPVGLELAERTIIPMIEAELAALREFDDRELELSLLLGRRYTDALRSHFANIPGVILTLQNNKTALQDGEAATRGVKAVSQGDASVPRNDGAAKRGGEGEGAPSGGCLSSPNKKVR